MLDFKELKREQKNKQRKNQRHKTRDLVKKESEAK
jgi:hypothetical protein